MGLEGGLACPNAARVRTGKAKEANAGKTEMRLIRITERAFLLRKGIGNILRIEG